MTYELLKSLHIIFVTTWFAALFYLPRLFIYHREAYDQMSMPHNENEQQLMQFAQKTLIEQFKIMERRLLFGICWPSAITVLIFGGSLLKFYWPITSHPWLIVKLVFVFFLFVYHVYLHGIYKQMQTHNYPLTSFQLRLINEVSSLFLVAIVFLVVFKDIMSMGKGLMGLLVFSMILVTGIVIYRKLRGKS